MLLERRDGPAVLIQMDSPGEQVPFLDRSHGLGYMRVVTWEDLMSGKVFEKASKKTADKSS